MTRRTGQLIAIALACWLSAAPALAELGGAVDTVQADRVHLRAALRQVAMPTHVRHELALPNGAFVHEFTNAQGQVFAIRWSGPGKPDLRSLLGSHFDAFQAANTSQALRFGRLTRRPMTLDSPDLMVESGGHMGYFHGLAWLPALLPGGVQPDDLQ